MNELQDIWLDVDYESNDSSLERERPDSSAASENSLFNRNRTLASAGRPPASSDGAACETEVDTL